MKGTRKELQVMQNTVNRKIQPELLGMVEAEEMTGLSRWTWRRSAYAGNRHFVRSGKRTCDNCVMNTLTRLNDLVGKRGLLKIRFGGEIAFTFLSVHPPSQLPDETDEDGFQDAITRSEFRVQFDDGTLIDGSNTMVVSGAYISRIKGS
jgi:hypothetical protein